MEEETFGKQLAAGNSAVVQLLTSMNLTNEDGLAKAKEIYAYIRDHFQVTEGFGYNFEKGIKTVIENSSGKAHEINLVLVAALQHAGFDADAVLFSTRDHGLVDPTYPLASDYNGVLCRLKLNGKNTFSTLLPQVLVLVMSTPTVATALPGLSEKLRKLCT